MTRLINDGWEFLKLPNGSSITDAKARGKGRQPQIGTAGVSGWMQIFLLYA